MRPEAQCIRGWDSLQMGEGGGAAHRCVVQGLRGVCVRAQLGEMCDVKQSPARGERGQCVDLDNVEAHVIVQHLHLGGMPGAWR